jgi:hypothetical protein
MTKCRILSQGRDISSLINRSKLLCVGDACDDSLISKEMCMDWGR